MRDEGQTFHDSRMPKKGMKRTRPGESGRTAHHHAPLRLQNSFCEEKIRGNTWRGEADLENTSRLVMARH
jgi:hypothetical protein